MVCCCHCSVAQPSPILWTLRTAVRQASLPLTISQSLPKFTFIASVMLSSHPILWPPLLLSIFPSIKDFCSESSVHIRWPKSWSFSFSISPSSEYSRLISLRLTGLISLLSKGILGVFSSTTVQRHPFFWHMEEGLIQHEWYPYKKRRLGNRQHRPRDSLVRTKQQQPRASPAGGLRANQLCPHL